MDMELLLDMTDEEFEAGRPAFREWLRGLDDEGFELVGVWLRG